MTWRSLSWLAEKFKKPAAPVFLSGIWRELPRIDLRSLALFRVLIAITIFSDLLSFCPELRFFLTDSGVYPRAFAIFAHAPEAFSLYFFSGTYAFTVFLFVLTALAALALLIGYRTRLAAFVCWFLIASLNVRAGTFLSAADIQLSVMLFWAMFLPLGARFSLDRALTIEPLPVQAFSSIAGLGLLLQVSYLYLMGALLKTGEAWQVQHSAVQAAITNIHLASPLAFILLQWPALMTGLTWFVYHLELTAALFLFFPFYNARIRLVMVALLVSMHLGFFTFMHISFFPLVSISGLTVFIPSFAWNRLGSWARRRGYLIQPDIYYDGDCEFCRKTCLIFAELSLVARDRVRPAQMDAEMYALLQRENSWIVRSEDGQLLLHWQAVAWLWRRSPLLWPLGVLFLPPFMRPVGRACYRFIAVRRRVFGALSSRLLPYRPTLRVQARFITSLALVPLIVFTLLWNVKNIREYKQLSVPAVMPSLLDYTALRQRWGMFAPTPTTHTSWATVTGTLEDGSQVDLLHGSDMPPSAEQPKTALDSYPSSRWYKLFEFYDWKRHWHDFGSAECRRWREEGHPLRLHRLLVTEYKQKNILGTDRSTWPVKHYNLVDFYCYDPPPKPTRAKH